VDLFGAALLRRLEEITYFFQPPKGSGSVPGIGRASRVSVDVPVRALTRLVAVEMPETSRSRPLALVLR
jgi:hypothetical protein